MFVQLLQNNILGVFDAYPLTDHFLEFSCSILAALLCIQNHSAGLRDEARGFEREAWFAFISLHMESSGIGGGAETAPSLDFLPLRATSSSY